MSKEQIEGIAKIICADSANKGLCEKCGFNKGCWKFKDAEALYNAGYRKQIEGEWLGSWDYKCSACHEYNDLKTKHCPNCGAKMKGADNGI